MIFCPPVQGAMIQVPVMPYDFQLFRQWYQDLSDLNATEY